MRGHSLELCCPDVSSRSLQPVGDFVVFVSQHTSDMLVSASVDKHVRAHVSAASACWPTHLRSWSSAPVEASWRWRGAAPALLQQAGYPPQIDTATRSSRRHSVFQSLECVWRRVMDLEHHRAARIDPASGSSPTIISTDSPDSPVCMLIIVNMVPGLRTMIQLHVRGRILKEEIYCKTQESK